MIIKINITKPSGTIISIEIPIEDDAIASQQPVVLESKPESVPEVSDKMEVEQDSFPMQEDVPSLVCEPESELENKPVNEFKIRNFIEDDFVQDSLTELDKIKFPIRNEGGVFNVSPSLVANFITAYGEEHVRTEFHKAKCWLLTHRSELKTHRGMGRFLNAWLCRKSGRPKAPIKQIIQNSFTTSGKQDSKGW